MKQGLKLLVEIQIDIPLDEIEKIEFVFTDGKNNELGFIYPSDKAVRDGNTIGLIWSQEETYKFKDTFEMDTRITLKDSKYNPETEIVKLQMNRTLFKEGSV